MMDYTMVEKKVKLALNELKKGNLIVVSDDYDRENEGDLIGAASMISYDSLNFMIKEGRGLVCAPISSSIANSLGLSQMVYNNSDSHKTAFTVSVDVASQTTTGISVSDRLLTLQALANEKSVSSDFNRPGHIFPLEAKTRGLFERRGHTEATIELLALAQLPLVGVICEIIDENGEMRRGETLSHFCKTNNLIWLTIDEIVYYLKMQSNFVTRLLSTSLPTQYGDFSIVAYDNRYDRESHFALTCGDLNHSKPPLVRLHSECLTGDTLGSLRCDCGEQLHNSMKMIQEDGYGVIIYLRQEGRGIGLFNKLKAYQLQEEGADTISANIALGFKADERDYCVGAAILRDLGINKVRLLTNNPEKVQALAHYGVDVVERVDCKGTSCSHNKLYLATKRDKMGHYL